MNNPRWVKELIDIRNKLYNDLPTGEVNAWELLQTVKWHINDIDSLCTRISETPEEAAGTDKTADNFPTAGLKYQNGIKRRIVELFETLPNESECDEADIVYRLQYILDDFEKFIEQKALSGDRTGIGSIETL